MTAIPGNNAPRVRLCCPVCGGALRQDAAAYVCARGHSFDLARQGYVNLLPGRRAAREAFYTAALFASRRQVFAGGYYAPLAARISQAARAFVRPNGLLLDAGCGEGYFTAAVLPDAPCARLGVDLSRAAVRMAAARYPAALFAVADIKRLPVGDHSADCVLNILTPADYAQFARVLRRGGCVIKAIPGALYLQELRALAAGFLRAGSPAEGAADAESAENTTGDGAPVADYFAARMRMISRCRVTYTLPVDAADAPAFLRMTPLLRRVPKGALDASALRGITIDMELLVGKKA